MRKDLLDKYVEQLSEEAKKPFGHQAEDYLRWLRNREPTMDSVRAYLEHLRKEHYADGSIAQKFGILRRLFKVNQDTLKQEGIEWSFHRGDSPVIRELEVYAPALDPDIVNRMIKVVRGQEPYEGRIEPTPRHCAFLALSTIYGVRREEMVKLRPGHIDLAHRTIFIETAKHGRQRYHVIPDAILSYLHAWRFPQISLSYASQTFVEIRNMVGFKGKVAYDIGWHSIRRILVQLLVRAGIEELDVNQYLRWKRSASNMLPRYFSTPVVSWGGTQRDLPTDDVKIDQAIFAIHPFLPAWTNGMESNVKM